MIQTLRNRETLMQLVRYGLAGGLITLLGAGIYWALVGAAKLTPLLAVTLSFLVCVTIGYGIHSGYSFRGHGARDRERKRQALFFGINLFAYGLNMFWTYALTDWLKQPEWTPMIPMVFLTPLVQFVMHRKWTFGT